MKNEEAAKIIRQYGTELKIIIGEAKEPVTVKAFLQPLRLNDRKNLFGNYLDIGADNNDEYLYVGEPKVRLDKLPFNTSIEFNEERYIVRYAKKIFFKDEIIYIRAILHKCTSLAST